MIRDGVLGSESSDRVAAVEAVAWGVPWLCVAWTDCIAKKWTLEKEVAFKFVCLNQLGNEYSMPK